MPRNTDDLRIREIKELSPPSHLVRELPCSERASATTYDARQAIHRILHGADERLLVVIGPCSIHDVDAAEEYASRLNRERSRFAASWHSVGYAVRNVSIKSFRRAANSRSLPSICSNSASGQR